mmetsp:Transcript_41851/g.67297  ORF Transcript_41851/g.67297 Transcript_41851/m.67297 type:complete len:274 (+) Transcript_41851:1487-2308(+)
MHATHKPSQIVQCALCGCGCGRMLSLTPLPPTIFSSARRRRATTMRSGSRSWANARAVCCAAGLRIRGSGCLSRRWPTWTPRTKCSPTTRRSRMTSKSCALPSPRTPTPNSRRRPTNPSGRATWMVRSPCTTRPSPQIRAASRRCRIALPVTCAKRTTRAVLMIAQGRCTSSTPRVHIRPSWLCVCSSAAAQHGAGSVTFSRAATISNARSCSTPRTRRCATTWRCSSPVQAPPRASPSLWVPRSPTPNRARCRHLRMPVLQGPAACEHSHAN